MTKPPPKPHPAYVSTTTKRVRINGLECVEICGSKWPEMVRDAEWWANSGQGRKK